MAYNVGSFEAFQKTVAAAGTAEQLASHNVPDDRAVYVKALKTNTDKVNIANSKTEAEADATSFSLEPGESIVLYVTNTSLIWVDADVNGEGIEVLVEKNV